MEASLAGVRALVTRPQGQGIALAQAIGEGGGVAVEFPLIEISPLGEDDAAERATRDAVLDGLGRFSVAIFASSNAVRALLAELECRGAHLPPTLRCLAIGSATARCLRDAGIACDAGEVTMDSEELLLLPELAALAGRQVVIFRGLGGREHLARELTARGARVTRCALYRRSRPTTACAQLPGLLARERINTVLLSSGEGLENLLSLLGKDAAGTIMARIVVVTPGERVAALARAAGLKTVYAAVNATDTAMLALLRSVAASIRERTSTA